MPTKKTPTPPRRIEYLPVTEVQEAEVNPKEHDTPRIASSVSRFGFADAPILDERTGRLVAGHGRLSDIRARLEDGKEPPEGIVVDDAGRWLMPVQRGWASRSDEDAAAFLVAHNRLTETGGWDDRQLAEMLDELRDVDPDLLDLTGYSDDDIEELIGGFDDGLPGEGVGPRGGADADPNRYTHDVNIPQYQPKRDAPPEVSEMLDLTKADALAARVDAHPGLPDDVRAFLRAAAARHAVFNYAAIAEFYAHAAPDVQGLMEESALVIIDVDDAIANGYVRMSSRLHDLREWSQELYEAGYRFDEDGRLPEEVVPAPESIKDGGA